MNKQLVTTLEDKLLVAFLAFLFFFSIGVALWSSLTGGTVNPLWNAPVVILALATIVRLVGAVPAIRSDVRYLREVADVRVQRMSNVKDFYDNLGQAVEQATATLDLTHIRNHPPADFGAGASNFFDRLVDWCAVEGRSIRRIICVQSPAMYEWARELAQETKALRQFRVRVIDWTATAPAMNMAIIDEKAVYLALTGATLERTRGLGIEDQTASEYFGDYYENLWNCAQDLDEWLDRNPAEGFASR